MELPLEHHCRLCFLNWSPRESQLIRAQLHSSRSRRLCQHSSWQQCFFFSLVCPKPSRQSADPVVFARHKSRNDEDFHDQGHTNIDLSEERNETEEKFENSRKTDAHSKQEKSDMSGILDFAELDKDTAMEILELELESELTTFKKEARTRHYEVMFLIHEACANEVQNVIEKVQDFIKEKNGKIWRLNDWGMRKLAYKIKKASRANYVLMNFEISADVINDFKSVLDNDERIIRHLVMTEKKAHTENTVPPPEYRDETSDEDIDDEYESEEELEEGKDVEESVLMEG